MGLEASDLQGPGQGTANCTLVSGVVCECQACLGGALGSDHRPQVDACPGRSTSPGPLLQHPQDDPSPTDSPSKPGWAAFPGTLFMGWATPGEGREGRGETMCVLSLQVQQDKGHQGAAWSHPVVGDCGRGPNASQPPGHADQ